MDEQRNPMPGQPWQVNYNPTAYPRRPVFSFGARELAFLAMQLILNIFLWNSILFGGFNLGFALGAVCLVGCSGWYLVGRGGKVNWYPVTLLFFGMVIGAGFARSDDGFVKYVMAHFLLLAVNLALCLMAGQNLRSPDGIACLLDAPRALFVLGVGSMDAVGRGINDARKNMGTAGKKGGAVALGLVIAVPLLAVMISLLMDADAAFEGLLSLIPQMDLSQLLPSLIFGLVSGWVMFAQGSGLRHSEKLEPKPRHFRGVSVLTVNTILAAVCAVYAVYLLSQLAYLSGGLAGILPEGYTLAQYARRGFFEMAWLCAMNLGIISAGVGLVEKREKAPLATRLLCLFIGIVTVFLVAAASAKMLLYIGGYGLTRLRVLTEVIMLFLGVSTVIVAVWLFAPKLPYMKVILLLALAMGTVTLWADVDTLVASYNVSAYQSGRLETVDVGHLASLGSGAVPYLYELTGDADPDIAQAAREALSHYYVNQMDFRGWNYTDSQAAEIIDAFRKESAVIEETE